MKTYKIDKQTAKAIAAVRRAQHDIDKIELSDTDDYRYHRGGFKPPDSPSIAYLKNGTMLPPFRCDIVERWTQIAENQQNYKAVAPDTTIYFTPADNGEVTLRCGQSSIRLYPIAQDCEPPIHPLPIRFENDVIVLDFDPKEITEKAKLLKSSKARAAKFAKETQATRQAETARKEYERCLAILTPEAINRCVKRVKRFRALKSWLRSVDKALESVPSLPQIVKNPLFNAFDPAYAEAYGDARLRYIEATRKRDNFKPRSWRSKGLEKHNENVMIALRRAQSTATAAMEYHTRAAGFEGGYDHKRYNANDVRRCRGYIRDYEREQRANGVIVASNLNT